MLKNKKPFYLRKINGSELKIQTQDNFSCQTIKAIKTAMKSWSVDFSKLISNSVMLLRAQYAFEVCDHDYISKMLYDSMKL